VKDFPDVELLGPPRFNWLGSILVWVGLGLWLSYILPDVLRAQGHEARLYLVVVVAIALALQYLLVADRDVVISVEGVRKGKSTFIRWRDATILYHRRGNRYLVGAGTKRIVLRHGHFADPQRFAEIMGYIRWIVHQQSLRQNARTETTSTPMHGLSAADRAEFLRCRGTGFAEMVFWPYLALPIVLFGLAETLVVEALVHKTLLPAAVNQAVRGLLHSCPLLFHGPAAFMIWFVAFVVMCLVAAQGLPRILAGNRKKAMRAHWIEDFDRAQIISINEVGLHFHDARRQGLYPWNDVAGISQSKNLILFHLVPNLPLSIVVPKRVFATPGDARDFYRKAQAFKRAALTRPSLSEPISFWEIA